MTEAETETEALPLPPEDRELYALRPWYHDFSALGVDTTFRDVPLSLSERVRRARAFASFRLRRLRRLRARAGAAPRSSPVSAEPVRSIGEIFSRRPSPHLLNQPVKEANLMALLERALPRSSSRPACVELFCADGYYSCRIKTLSPGARVTAVELDPDHIARGEAIARRLGLDDVIFCRDDVRSFLDRQAESSFDLVLCAGGLYHLADPVPLLGQMKRVSRGYVLIQSVVTLATEDAGYFATPAPGWEHGCRFTHGWLRDRLREQRWSILGEARAELPGNRRRHDRGASFFLCHV